MIVLDPTNRMQMQCIRYEDNGTHIYYQSPVGADEKQIQKIKDNIDIDLQLNGVLDSQGHRISDTTTQIVKSRKDAYNNYQLIVKELGRKGRLTSQRVEKTIENLLSEKQYRECVGVIIFYLQRKKRQLKSQGR